VLTTWAAQGRRGGWTPFKAPRIESRLFPGGGILPALAVAADADAVEVAIDAKR
jgi:hypothetical protein